MRFKITSSRVPTRAAGAAVRSNASLKIRGLGDLVHLSTAPVRAVFPKLNDCPGCKKRRADLNEWMPL